jgi:hypothetical protein
MGIGSIGSTPSFWQQDQSYWTDQQNESSAQSADASLINVMSEAETNLGKGLASIANGEALTRTKSQLTAAIQAVLNGSSSSSSTSSTGSTSSSSTSSSSSTATPTPATGTGTVPLTTSTPLSTLGILPGDTFSIDDGTNITKYTSTGTDTVGNLISAINSGPAFVTASLNAGGNLTITARNTKEIVTVQGSGTTASVLGFGTNNQSFTPVEPKTSSASTASSSSSTSSTSNSTSTSSKSTSSSSSTAVSSIGEEISSSAASILSASGVSGTLVDMLA